MIRPERVGEEEAIRSGHTAAYGRAVEARSADGVRASEAFVPELSLVGAYEGIVARPFQVAVVEPRSGVPQGHAVYSPRSASGPAA